MSPDEVYAKDYGVQAFLYASEMLVMEAEEEERKKAERKQRRK